jgi:hypothetical protein
MDTIAMRSFKALFDNPAIFFYENPANGLTNTFFIAKKGHPFLLNLMEIFAIQYDQNEPVKTGRTLITANVQNYCKVDNIDMLNYKNNQSNCDIRLYPYSYYSPFNSTAITNMFDANRYISGPEFENTHLVSFNASATSKLPVNWKQETFYELLASLNCPFVEALASKGL